MRHRLFLATGFAGLLLGGSAEGQVIFDGSMGPAGPASTRIVPGFGLDHLVTYDERSPDTDNGVRFGDNLYQSLLELSVGAGDRATFQAFDPGGNPLAFENLIVRVTGDDPSTLVGVLRSEIPNADLFLLNPRGVLFQGTGALSNQLDVPAGFFAATAEQLVFQDAVFEVTDLDDPSLSVHDPQAFGFLGGGPAAPIRLDATRPLGPPTGHTILLAGGDVTLTGEAAIEVASGVIQLAAVGESAGSVPVELSQWSVRGLDAPLLGAIEIDTDSTVRGSATLTNDLQGRIVMRAGRLVVDDSLVQAGGNGGVGELAIDVEVAGDVVVRNDSRLQVFGGRASGNSGGRISGNTLVVRDADSIVGARTFGGTTAPFEIDVREARVTSSGAVVSENLGGTAGAELVLRVEHLDVGAGGSVRTRVLGGSAPAGNLVIEAGRVDVRDGGTIEVSSSGGAPEAGNLVLRAETLDVRDAGFIATRGVAGAARAGDLIVDVGTMLVGRSAGAATPGGIEAASDASAGGDIRLDADLLLVSGGGQISTTTAGDFDAGSAFITVDNDLAITGDDPDIPSGIFARSGINPTDVGTGNGGDIHVDAGSLVMTGNAAISTRTFGGGNAGAIDIASLGDVQLVGDGNGIPTISARAFTGNGGTVTVGTGGSFELRAGGAIATSALQTGDAGDILIDAKTLLVSGANENGTASAILSESAWTTPDAGSSGRIQITVGDALGVVDGGRLSVTTIGPGNSDVIDIRAGDTVEVAGGGEIASRSRGSGRAGDIEIRGARSVVVSAGGIVTAESTASGNAGSIVIEEVGTVAIRSGGRMSATAMASGEAGDVSIRAAEILLSGGEVTTDASNGTANVPGGNIVVSGRDAVALTDGALVSARTFGSQRAGNITVESDSLVHLTSAATVSAAAIAGCDPCAPGDVGDAGTIAIDGGRQFRAVESRVSTEARASAGGDISIGAREQVDLIESEVSTSVLGGAGGGGNIAIGVAVRPTLAVLNSAFIKAQADEGNGGNIAIAGETLLISADTVVDASSRQGTDGRIVIETPESELLDPVIRLPEAFLDAAELLKAHCAARGAEQGSFVVRGRDGMPESPDEPLPSRTPLARTNRGSGARVPPAVRHLATLDCRGFAKVELGGEG